MSQLQYFAYPGVGERNLAHYKYNQAVRVGDRIECSGQGGWDPKTGTYPPSQSEEIAQAFANVDLCLKHAGGQGWNQVFRVNSYHVTKPGGETTTTDNKIEDAAMEGMIKGFEKWMPDHKPIWTTIGIVALGEKEMTVEIEVVAYDGEGARGVGK